MKTGFFEESRPPPLWRPKSMVPLHELTERASGQTSPRLEFISHIRASRRSAVCSRPAAVRRLQSYRLAATVRLPQSDESRTVSDRSAATASALGVLRSYRALGGTKQRLDATGDSVFTPGHLVSPLNDRSGAARPATAPMQPASSYRCRPAAVCDIVDPPAAKRPPGRPDTSLKIMARCAP